MKKIILLMYLVFFIQPLLAKTLNVHFLSEGKYLAAEISKPTSPKENLSAIIFLTGSGPYSYKDNYKSFLDNFLGDLKEEFLIMNYDKPGVGGSDGSWVKEDFHCRALHTYNAAWYLKENFKVKNIYLVGHSQGGWIAQLCLAKFGNMFSGAVSMAGPTFSVKEQLINDFQSDYKCNKNLDEQKALKKAKQKTSRVLMTAKLFPVNEQLKQLKVIEKFDIRPYLKKIDKPILYMWAENDRLVDSDWSIKVLNQVFSHDVPSYFDMYVDPGANHSFLISDFCGNPQKDDYSIDSKEVMKEWLLKKVVL